MSEKMIVACPECHTRFVAPMEKFLPDGRKVRCAKCGHAWFQKIDGTAEAIPATAPKQTEPVSKPSSPTDSIIARADQRRTERAEQAEQAVHSASATAGAAAAATISGDTEPGAAEREAERFGAAATVSDNAVPPMPQSEPVATPKKKRGFFPRLILYSLAAAIIAGVLAYFYKDPIAEKVPGIEPQLTAWQETVDGALAKIVPPANTLVIEDIRYQIDETDGEPELRLSAKVTNYGNAVKPAPKLDVKVLDVQEKVLHETTLSPENLATEIAADAQEEYFWRLPFPSDALDSISVTFAE